MWVSAVSEPWPVGDAKEEDAYRSAHPGPQRLRAPHHGIVTNTSQCMVFLNIDFVDGSVAFECQKVGHACKNLSSLELCF